MTVHVMSLKYVNNSVISAQLRFYGAFKHKMLSFYFERDDKTCENG